MALFTDITSFFNLRIKSTFFKLVQILVISLIVQNPAWSASILILGDSLSAGYGITKEEGWVHLLSQSMPQHKIINGSVSGETSAGGLRRLPSLLASSNPDVLVIELGGNDGLRGFPPKQLQSNLSQIIEQGQQQGIKVLLTEIMVPPNYGPRYSQKFNQVFHQLSSQYNVSLIPFFMTEIATDPTLMQRDGIHPNAKAQKTIANWMLPWISKAVN